MTCGDSQAQWVSSLLGVGTYTGSLDDGATGVALVLLALDNVATMTVGGIPLVGQWDFRSGLIEGNVATEGITYNFSVHADSCTGTPSHVSAASGTATDALENQHDLTLTRLV